MKLNVSKFILITFYPYLIKEYHDTLKKSLNKSRQQPQLKRWMCAKQHPDH